MSDPALAAELITVRDFLRFAVSRFTEAKLSFGHGTATALDEAAFLILTTLHLPIDTLEPWLDARLTRPERARVLEVIETRVVTRKPASYIVKSAWIGPHAFYVDERVIVPRSYLGEMLNEGLGARLDMDLSPTRILDLCTGSGCLAIMAALEFPDAEVTAVDLSPAALQVAAINVETYGLADRVQLLASDLFAALESERFDLILTNPPYVTQAAVDAFPAEYQAEPQMAHLGGADGMDLVRRILAEAGQHLTADGVLVAEVGSGRATLEADFPALPFLWLDSEGSEGGGVCTDGRATGLESSKASKARGRKAGADETMTDESKAKAKAQLARQQKLREERRAKALRDNLKRRKTQTRERDKDETGRRR